MEILYVMVFISLGFSLSFLILFFWAVNTNQMSSLDSVSWSILENDEAVNVNNKNELSTKGKSNE